MVKVSVVVPVYNVEAYIAETIESILRQTYVDLELIIVDDASQDRSIEICQQFKDPRIKIIRQHNRGLAGARNTGIRHAKGEYIALLDSDDLWLPEKLETHVNHLNLNPNVGVSYCPSAFIDEFSKPLGISQTPKLTDITSSVVICHNPVGNGSSPVIRREVFTAIKFQANLYGTVEDFYFDDTFRQSEDIECWLRIALQTNWQFAGIPQVLTLYRVNSGGLSANVMKQLESWERMITKIREYAPKFIAQWEQLARAYQLRYLARRSIRNRDGKAAVYFIHKALSTNWRIFWEEPKRTMLSLIAAYLLYFLPLSFFFTLESLFFTLNSKALKFTKKEKPLI